MNIANSKQDARLSFNALVNNIVHCSYFDQHAMQSLNDFKFSLNLPVEIFGIWGLVIYRWKCLENTFPMMYYTPQKFNIITLQSQNENEKFVIIMAVANYKDYHQLLGFMMIDVEACKYNNLTTTHKTELRTTTRSTNEPQERKQ